MVPSALLFQPPLPVIFNSGPPATTVSCFSPTQRPLSALLAASEANTSFARPALRPSPFRHKFSARRLRSCGAALWSLFPLPHRLRLFSSLIFVRAHCARRHPSPGLRHRSGKRKRRTRARTLHRCHPHSSCSTSQTSRIVIVQYPFLVSTARHGYVDLPPRASMPHRLHITDGFCCGFA